MITDSIYVTTGHVTDLFLLVTRGVLMQSLNFELYCNRFRDIFCKQVKCSNCKSDVQNKLRWEFTTNINEQGEVTLLFLCDTLIV